MTIDSTKNGIWLRKTESQSDAGTSGCFFGGLPNLPPHIDWPFWGDEGFFQVPLHFLLQIDLSVLPDIQGGPNIARHGTLFFFVDPVFAPVLGYDQGGIRVIYFEGSATDFPEREVPEGLPVNRGDENGMHVSHDYSSMRTSQYPRWPIVPTVFPRRVPQNFSDEWMENHEKPLDADGNRSDLQIAFHSLFFGPDEHEEEWTYMHLEKGNVPLLLLDGDFDIEFGMSYLIFWINENELSQNNFENVVVRSF